MTDTLSHLLAAHAAAQAAWDAIKHLEDPPFQAIFDAKEKAELAVNMFPCATMDDVRRKAEFVLNDANAYDSVRNCFVNETHVLKLFLRSLIGETT